MYLYINGMNGKSHRRDAYPLCVYSGAVFRAYYGDLAAVEGNTPRVQLYIRFVRAPSGCTRRGEVGAPVINGVATQSRPRRH